MGKYLKNENVVPVEDFLRVLYTASSCRHKASSRLRNKGAFSFATTTFLSMGLIFMPLMQTTGLTLSFPIEVLNILQIFLAVSVLVYSIINSQARYGVRSKALSECGDQIKKLARELDAKIAACDEKDKFDYEYYRERYVDIDIDVENHSQQDWVFAIFVLQRFYVITPSEKCCLIFKAYCNNILSYFAPVCILLFELAIILDMLDIINIISPVFIALKS